MIIIDHRLNRIDSKRFDDLYQAMIESGYKQSGEWDSPSTTLLLFDMFGLGELFAVFIETKEKRVFVCGVGPRAAEEAIETYSADEEVTISACERVLERSE